MLLESEFKGCFRYLPIIALLLNVIIVFAYVFNQLEIKSPFYSHFIFSSNSVRYGAKMKGVYPVVGLISIKTKKRSTLLE